ncbi:hypothetical protein [Aliiroseovarius sp. PrR006]|uniref:hypothetical protein n=1 Tax=Aliiroseovarius sp. PrR006 TaxID=2706883 RepID=UPI0013D01C20|nr:hypothetical protein [Aliiroseovarius sp. PrR006]NDW53897.1 hypothetical protein [Aliiroseovarius sp. PrR006]
MHFFHDGLKPTPAEVQLLRNKLVHGIINAAEAAVFLRFSSSATAPPGTLTDQIEAWDALCRSVSIPCEPLHLAVPDFVDGFERLIIVPEQITLHQVITLLKRNMDVWVHPEIRDELDGMDLQNRRFDHGSYTIWVREGCEAERELEHNQVPTITLMERLLLGLLRFKQSGEQLDVIGGTLCSGTRTSSGRIPYVEWSDEDTQLAISTRSDTAPASLVRPRQVII